MTMFCTASLGDHRSCLRNAPSVRKPFRRFTKLKTASQARRRSARPYLRHQRLRAQDGTQSFTEPEPYVDQEYTPESNAAYWATRPVLVTKRALQIGSAFAMWFTQTRLSRKGGDLTTLTNKQAERLRITLTELGPAFVKIGQAVSSRPDVTPPDYLRELEKLQDQIPAFDDREAMAVMQQELGTPPDQLFSYLATSPTAAASLGQVYRGVLRSNGQPVAVKVQRPGVRESIALDIFILRYLAGKVKAFRKVNSDLPALLDEWAASLFRELDYVREAQNGVRFKTLYGDLEGVYVPAMYTELTTRRVLVMEWVDGQRLKNQQQGAAAAREELKMVEIGVRCSLEQMLEEGYYHSDPHPGNLFKLDTGKLAYIDFGMMGEIEAPIRRGLIQATLHLVNREFDALADDFVVLGLLPPGSDKTKITPALTGVFQKALANGINSLNFGDLSGNLGQTMYEYNFRIPPYYTLLVRSLSVLEGIALSADPNYKVLGAAYPWIARRLLTEQSIELRDTLHTLLYKKGRFQFARLESLLQQAARSPGRQTWQTNGADQVRAATGSSPLELLLGPEGEYVREIVIDELAKGIDAALRLNLDSFLASARFRLLRFAKKSPRQAQKGQVQGAPGLLFEALSTLPDLAGQEDQQQIDGINRLVKVMSELGSPAASASPPQPQLNSALQPQASSQLNGRVSSTVNSNAVRVNSQYAASTSSHGPASGVALRSSQSSSASASRPEAVQGSSPVLAVQQTVQMLQWFVQEASQLPTAARLEALRIPLALGSKVSSRLVARAARAVLAPGVGSMAGVSPASREPASASPRLRDNTSALALRNVQGSAFRSKNGLGGTSAGDNTRNGAVQPEEEDPFIKDTQDLMNSMQMTSPSWNPEGDAAIGNSSSYANAELQQQQSNDSSAQPETDRRDPAKASSTNGAGRSYTATFSSSSSSPPVNGRRSDKNSAIEMVQFDRGTSRSDMKDVTVVRRNGAEVLLE